VAESVGQARTLGQVGAEEMARRRLVARPRHTAERGRVCSTCPTVLSIYNLGEQCRPCILSEAGIDGNDSDTTDGGW
jgi:hypothetical protein